MWPSSSSYLHSSLLRPICKIKQIHLVGNRLVGPFGHVTPFSPSLPQTSPAGAERVAAAQESGPPQTSAVARASDRTANDTGNGRVRQVGFDEVLILFLRRDRKQHYWGRRSYFSLLAETRATLTDQSSTDSVHFAVLCQLDSLLNNAFGTMGTVSSGLGS